MSESRTSKSLKNAWVALFFYAINVIIGFWKRQVFFDYLGSEVLGLDTTASTLFSFLNLAELGIGASVGYFLYRPMFQHSLILLLLLIVFLFLIFLLDLLSFQCNHQL